MTADGKGLGPKKQYKTKNKVPKDKGDKEKTAKAAKIPKDTAVKAVRKKRPPKLLAPRKSRKGSNPQLEEETQGTSSRQLDEELQGAGSCQLGLGEEPQVLGEQFKRRAEGGRPESGDEIDYNRFNYNYSEGDGSPYFKEVLSESSSEAEEQTRRRKTRKSRSKRYGSSSSSSSETDESLNGANEKCESINGGWGAGCDNEDDTSGSDKAIDSGSDGN
jgi:hypothetical protein